MDQDTIISDVLANPTLSSAAEDALFADDEKSDPEFEALYQLIYDDQLAQLERGFALHDYKIPDELRSQLDALIAADEAGPLSPTELQDCGDYVKLDF